MDANYSVYLMLVFQYHIHMSRVWILVKENVCVFKFIEIDHSAAAASDILLRQDPYKN